MDSSLKSMLDQLSIAAEDQSKLETIHQITNYQTLKAKRSELDSETLEQIDFAVQKIVAVALAYLGSLRDSGDPLPLFTKLGWRDFAIKHGEGHPANNKTVEVVSEDSMEIDDDDDDDDMGRLPVARRKIKIDDTKGVGVPKQDRLQGPEEEEKLGKFELMDQGFHPNDDVLPAFDVPETNASKGNQANRLTCVDFNGRRFNKRQCYETKRAKGDIAIVGIRSFKSETEANCVMVVHISKTFLGTGELSDKFEDAMEEHNPSFHVQVNKTEVLHLSELEQEASFPNPEYMPDMIYEPQTNRNRQSFSYTYDHCRSNQVRVCRKEIRLLEAFAGAGGMHLGYKEEGFKTAMAVELNAAAVNTFSFNNPDVPVFQGDVNEFTKKMETDPDYRKSLGRIDAIHVSSPCQGFSKANRNGGQNDEINNKLSYTFVDWLRASGALVGTFENVEGMWSRKGMPYLRKLLVDTIAMGYQIRLMVLRACDYGDPQERPRLIIFAAKKFVQMPNRPHRTHGLGKGVEPYVTTKEVLDFLCSPEAKKENYPNMSDCKTTTKKVGEDEDFVQLDPHGLAPTVLASGPAVFHYSEKGRDGNLRCINVREAAALQSFPFDYTFLGTQTEKYKQAGNAVPVNFAAAIARTIRGSVRLIHKEEMEQQIETSSSINSDTSISIIGDGDASSSINGDASNADDSTAQDDVQMAVARIDISDESPSSDGDSD